MKIIQDETIAAISTASAAAGIGVIRISGEHAFDVADKIFRGKKKIIDVKNRSILHGHIVDDQEKIIDEVLILAMRAPNSYTREDVVEIQSHGGTMVLRSILQRVLNSGARSAQRGEFTKRAFLNGRIDLSQAQAVMDIVQAKTEQSLKFAEENLAGRMSRKIRDIQADILELLANLEALIDFPEEDVDAMELDEIREKIFELEKIIDDVLKTARVGKIFRDGIKVALIGKPNVGKSSLLNLLLKEDRAIVTNIPGTTRDSIEEIVNLDGIPLIIIDTAGIRTPSDEVEKLGIERSKKSIEQAELIIAIFDGSKDLSDDDQKILELIENRNRILIVNKKDLPQKFTLDDSIQMSIKFGDGEDVLKSRLEEKIFGDSTRDLHTDSGFLRDAREENILQRTKVELKSAVETIDAGLDADFVSINLRSAWEILNEFTGENVSEKVIDLIFEKFCVGK